MQHCWMTGSIQLRCRTLEQHGNWGLHYKSLAFRESPGTSTTVIGILRAPIRQGINGLFQVVYCMAKRGSPPAHIPGDVEALMLGGGTVTPAYHSSPSVRYIVHAIAATIRFVEGEAIETSLFFALASNGSTDLSANKQELLYTRTLREGQVCTAFLGFWELRDGTTPSIVAAYKQTMLKAGLPSEKWVSRMFWYCAHGAEVMQSAGNGVAGLLMQLQAEGLGYSAVVPMHANVCITAQVCNVDAPNIDIPNSAISHGLLPFGVRDNDSPRHLHRQSRTVSMIVPNRQGRARQGWAGRLRKSINCTHFCVAQMCALQPTSAMLTPPGIDALENAISEGVPPFCVGDSDSRSQRQGGTHNDAHGRAAVQGRAEQGRAAEEFNYLHTLPCHTDVCSPA